MIWKFMLAGHLVAKLNTTDTLTECPSVPAEFKGTWFLLIIFEFKALFCNLSTVMISVQSTYQERAGRRDPLWGENILLSRHGCSWNSCCIELFVDFQWYCFTSLSQLFLIGKLEKRLILKQKFIYCSNNSVNNVIWLIFCWFEGSFSCFHCAAAFTYV